MSCKMENTSIEMTVSGYNAFTQMMHKERFGIGPLISVTALAEIDCVYVTLNVKYKFTAEYLTFHFGKKSEKEAI